jgi:hypothetical protein
MVLFKEEVLKGVFFLVEFEDFLSYSYFRHNVTINCLKYRDYFGYVFERKPLISIIPNATWFIALFLKREVK